MGMEEDFRSEWLPMLRELKEFLKTQKKAGPRPTEAIVPRTELLIRNLIERQEAKCTQACEKRINDSTGPLCKDFKRLEQHVNTIDNKIFKEVEGVEEASKTANRTVLSIENRISVLENRLAENNGYENRMNSAEAYIIAEKKKEKEEKSSFRDKLTILTIVISLIFGLAGTAIGVIQLLAG